MFFRSRLRTLDKALIVLLIVLLTAPIIVLFVLIFLANGSDSFSPLLRDYNDKILLMVCSVFLGALLSDFFKSVRERSTMVAMAKTSIAPLILIYLYIGLSFYFYYFINSIDGQVEYSDRPHSSEISKLGNQMIGIKNELDEIRESLSKIDSHN